jgi:hypothetical protein
MVEKLDCLYRAIKAAAKYHCKLPEVGHPNREEAYRQGKIFAEAAKRVKQEKTALSPEMLERIQIQGAQRIAKPLGGKVDGLAITDKATLREMLTNDRDFILIYNYTEEGQLVSHAHYYAPLNPDQKLHLPRDFYSPYEEGAIDRARHGISNVLRISWE